MIPEPGCNKPTSIAGGAVEAARWKSIGAGGSPPWHRAYLYFYERILASLIGDTTLALTYWDWFNPSDGALYRTIPKPFTTPNDRTNSLWDGKRRQGTTDKIPSIYVSYQT